MADNGTRNVVISLDMANARIKIMKILGQSHKNSIIEYLPFDNELVKQREYGKMFETGLSRYVKKANLHLATFYVVIPDELVINWKINVPTLNRIKTEEAMKSELLVDLGNPKDFIVSTEQIASTKNSTTFLVSCVRRDVIRDIKSALTRVGIEAKVISNTSCSVANAVMALRTRARSGTFILADMRHNETSLALVSKKRILQYETLPFGFEMLRTDGFMDEESLIPHDSATLVVSKAMDTTTDTLKNDSEDGTENVKFFDLDFKSDGMMSTADIAEFEKEVDEAIKSAEEERLAAGEDAMNITDTIELPEDKPFAAFEGGEHDVSGDTAEIIDIPTNIGDVSAPVGSDAPAFGESTMEILENNQLDTSEIVEMSDTDVAIAERFNEANGRMHDTIEEPMDSNTSDLSVTGVVTDTINIEVGSPKDMVERNFKTVYKHMLLFLQSVRSDPDMPDPDHIIVNFPKRFAFLLARANKSEDREIEFKYFNPTIEDNPRFTENLDMFGALFAKVYNKGRSF